MSRQEYRRAKRVIVRGRVQGVSYRASLQRKAITLKIQGFCLNLPDGQEVEAILLGNETDLSQLLAWCEQGPPLALVEQIHVEDVSEESIGSLAENFEVRY